MSTSDTAATGVSRGILIALGAIVVLGLLWFFVINPLFFAADEDDDDFVVERPQATEQPTGDDIVGEPGEPDTEDILETLPIETYEIFLARDPFSPVVPAPDTGGTVDGGTDGTTDDGTDGGTDGGADGGTDDPDDGDRVALLDIEGDRALIRVDGEPWVVEETQVFGPNFEFQLISIDPPCVTIEGPDGRFTECIGDDDGDGTNGDGTDGDGDGDADGDGCTRRNGEVVCDGRVVSVVDVFVEDGEERAVIQVDSTLFEVREGETFAEHFQALSIDPPCVTLLFGDDSFTLCEGERVLK